MQRTDGELDMTGVALQRTGVALQRTGGAVNKTCGALQRTGGAIERSRHVLILDPTAAHTAGPLMPLYAFGHFRSPNMELKDVKRRKLT